MKKEETKPKEYSLERLFDAYYDCRKHKRNTMQAMKFEFELEKNIFELHNELLNGTYEIGKSICFIIREPKLREVWAGSFRDRIVHHLIYNAIKDRFISSFIKETYSCIPNRGTLRGAWQAAKYAKNVTRNYTQTAYFMKADIMSFFNNIDKHILFKEILKLVYEPWLVDLIKQVLFHNPVENVFLKSPKELYKLLPSYKSLFSTHPDKGLPIGNLTSQFFSNIYMNPLDQYAKNELGCRYYCRYVDDILILDKDPKFLNWAYDKMDKFLKDNLLLTLNPKKKNMNHIHHGFDFVGHVIKPNRIHIRTRTRKKAFKTFKTWDNNPNKFSQDVLEKYIRSLNSYIGMCRHTNGYNLRKQLCEMSENLFIGYDKEYTKIFSKGLKTP